MTDGARPVGVPTLEELVKDPALLEGLPHAVRLDLFRIVGRLHVELDASLRGDAAAARPTPAGSQALYDVKTTAKILGVSADWVYRHRRTLPFAVRIGRRLMFSPQDLSDYLRRRTGRLQ